MSVLILSPAVEDIASTCSEVLSVSALRASESVTTADVKVSR